MPIAYEGDKPYIFVSYSHRNSKYIHGVIEHLQSAGYRVWFDGGIEAGSEWPEYIASHLEACNCVLTFMSNAFVASDNCKRELHFAQDLKKPLLNVYIEEVNLPAGLRMQLGLCQAMYRENFRTEGEFRESLVRARILEACRDKSVEAVVMPPVSQKDPDPREEGVFSWSPDEKPLADIDGSEDTLEEYEKDLDDFDDEIDDLMDEDDASEEDLPMPAGMKLLGWLTILLELSYCLVGPELLDYLTASKMGAWKLILVSALPHIVIAVINSLLLKAMRGETAAYAREKFSIPQIFLALGTSAAAVLLGVSCVNYDLAGFIRFLIALGLNVIPAAVAFLIYAFNIGSGKD